MLFGVLYTVFSVLLNFSGDERFYPVALLLGIVMYSFLNEATGGAVRSLVNRENLVRKIEFPRLAVPDGDGADGVLQPRPQPRAGDDLPDRLRRRAALDVAGDAAHASPSSSRWAAGIAMLLSALFVRYRDIEPIWTVVLQILFYVTPIFYTVSLVREKSSESRRAADDAATRSRRCSSRRATPSSTPRTRVSARRWAARCGSRCRCSVTVVVCVGGLRRLLPRGAARRRGALGRHARRAERAHVGQQIGDERAGRRARRGTARPCAGPRTRTACHTVASRRRALEDARELPAALELEVVDARLQAVASGSAAR